MAWKQVWKNAAFAIDVEWTYSQNPVDNTTTYTVHQLRCRSLASTASFTRTQGIDAGIATITEQRVIKKNLAGTCNANSSKTWNLANDSRTVKHSSTGATPTTVNVHGYLDVNLSGSELPAGGWKVANVAESIPDIDRRAPNTNNVSFVSSTYNSLTIKLDCSAQCNYAAYKLNGGSWEYFTPPTAIVENTGTANYTISGLSPNTTYKVEVAYRRTYNRVWGYSSAVNMTTKKPAAPSSGAITASNITHKSIDFTLSGCSATSPASISRYEYWGNGKWNSNGSSPTWKRTGLSPNTTYLAEMRAIDNYETASSYVSLNATTKKPPIPTVGTVSVSNITSTSATATISGFVMGDMASLSNYRYKVLNSAGTEVIPVKNIGTTTTISITGLKANNSYTIYVDAVDNYGQSNSGWATKAFKTLNPGKPNAGDIIVSRYPAMDTEYQRGYNIELSNYSVGEGTTLSKLEYTTKFISYNGTETDYIDWTTKGPSIGISADQGAVYFFKFKITDSLGQYDITEEKIFEVPIDEFCTKVEDEYMKIPGRIDVQVPLYLVENNGKNLWSLSKQKQFLEKKGYAYVEEVKDGKECLTQVTSIKEWGRVKVIDFEPTSVYRISALVYNARDLCFVFRYTDGTKYISDPRPTADTWENINITSAIGKTLYAIDISYNYTEGGKAYISIPDMKVEKIMTTIRQQDCELIQS